MSNEKTQNYIQGFAVIRVDDFSTDSDVTEYEIDGQVMPAPGPGNVKVKEILLSASEAQNEVTRLNEINSDKGCRYFWQTTHVFINGGSHGATGEERSMDDRLI